MIKGLKIPGVTLAAAALTFLGTALAEEPDNQAPQSASAFTQEQLVQLEEIIHKYIVTHPEVLVEAAQMMELKRQVEVRLKTEDLADEFAANPAIPFRYGDENSKHHIVEFFDYNCGYCKMSRPILESFAKENNIKVHYVEFPVLSEHSVEASLIGMALYGQDPQKYFAYQDYLMSSDKKIESRKDIQEAVMSAGAVWSELAEAAKDPKIQQLIASNIEKGRSIGVTGVPFYIVDGRALRGAVKGQESFRELLRE